MTLTDVARGADLHPAKAHRYLVSLTRAGLASQNPSTGLYDLGPRLRRLGIEALRRTSSVSTVSAYATELRDETGHTVDVGVWTDQGPALVRWDAGVHALPIAVCVGSILPVLDSAIGYVFLTYLPAASTREVLRVQQREAKTRQAGAKEIEEIRAETRRAGYSRTINRMILGQAALGAPVFGADERLEAVIGLITPAAVMTDVEAPHLGELLRGAANRASLELGSLRAAA